MNQEVEESLTANLLFDCLGFNKTRQSVNKSTQTKAPESKRMNQEVSHAAL